MAKAQLNTAELAARRALLEQRIEGYRASLSTISGPCSKSSLHRLIDVCEMELEEIRNQMESAPVAQ